MWQHASKERASMAVYLQRPFAIPVPYYNLLDPTLQSAARSEQGFAQRPFPYHALPNRAPSCFHFEMGSTNAFGASNSLAQEMTGWEWKWLTTGTSVSKESNLCAIMELSLRVPGKQFPTR
ncbi:hypothetical protein KC19_VG132900 [Ceratodon purpureus]|uniref:Uncharacterized protein n=1 Tax=Ceratodon purpureus TaxID=3225 RepID=A0A8T0HPS4_CERPU|nr:hypothetical protein KC19_VG132900 [Ceratodon purpureus]